MGQYDCNFCNMGKYNRNLIFKLTKDLSRSEMQYLIRFRIIEEALQKRRKIDLRKKEIGGIK